MLPTDKVIMKAQWPRTKLTITNCDWLERCKYCDFGHQSESDHN